MSTNYYWNEPACTAPCRHCPGADELHIGKSAGNGWSFEGHFRGEQPWLTTADEWWRWLRGQDGVIRDEYRQEHDVETFIAEVLAVPVVGRRRQYDWLWARRHGPYGFEKSLDRVEPGCDWLDPDGFSFHGGEFS